MQDIINGRCGWCGTDELYVKYHDEEWGKTVTDDKTLFEFLVLESAQAGLSWITILKKREGYRSFFPDRNPIINHFQSLSEIPVSSPESDAMSKDMKKRGFKFFGSTICYAHLQASGFINDHLTDCICRNQKQ
ncbi:DNA-3-methyladenine glycosylase I [Bacteroides uniformis]|uniref:DNA-3-methyladenine glycosylase I n=1 Tax=Bacteroides uniformis TaxID=820 RepID=UPI001F1C85E5|nr:DNA-3-methyladenine glycosylase I [Bacteroides uniformis]MCE8485952.1 DNA-3-methyladenine glycosylase I [Bacteroides uniformis]